MYIQEKYCYEFYSSQFKPKCTSAFETQLRCNAPAEMWIKIY